ncbi:unnamed protein product [Brassica rapa]|uniref:BZIP domain-containing protein n=1 Tax=Brassica campestris TaxID=3711 RepID=A0A8D9DAB5_BRACM|nr:unnamed protein product [Brassica rapa]
MPRPSSNNAARVSGGVKAASPSDFSELNGLDSKVTWSLPSLTSSGTSVELYKYVSRQYFLHCRIINRQMPIFNWRGLFLIRSIVSNIPAVGCEAVVGIVERRFCPYASCFSHNNFVFCRKRQLLLKCGNVKTMGKSEEPKVTKSDNKPSSPPADQTNVHVYPDWAAMQAYYGPRVAMPPYYNSAMAAASGHPPPPYMWNPQHMMSPYGTPYAAVYPHGGGVYAHPGFPMGSQPQGQKGATPLTTPGTPLNIDTPSKSTGNTENGLMKKLKEFDGLAMSLGNGNNGDEGKRSRNSSETDGSSDGSDGNTTGADEPKLKRSREGTPAKDEKKHLVQSSSFRSVSQSSGDNNCVKPSVQGGGGAIVSAAGVSANSNPTFMSQSLAMVPPETWLQNERELKRERRKQSNRESARRSRLRKQAETEELARKVEALTAENMALRSELNQLNEKSNNLRGANATLLDKLKSSEPEKRVKSSGNGDDKNKKQGDNETNSTSKLHQLLDTKPRADGVAAR